MGSVGYRRMILDEASHGQIESGHFETAADEEEWL